MTRTNPNAVAATPTRTTPPARVSGATIASADAVGGRDDLGVRRTPGKWSVEPRDKLDTGDVQRPWVGDLDASAFSALACGETVEQAFANAHLIAAAPDMFDALQEVTTELAEFADILVNGVRDERMGGMVDRAKAALAKARGEES